MKFWLSRTSNRLSAKAEEINLESLDDLLALAKQENEELIVSIYGANGHPSIEIYDWYRE